MKTKKTYRKKTGREKQIDRDDLLKVVMDNRADIASALGTLAECNDLWMADVRALQTIEGELKRVNEENVILGNWDSLTYHERQNTSSKCHYTTGDLA